MQCINCNLAPLECKLSLAREVKPLFGALLHSAYALQSVLLLQVATCVA
jgi:hypothetical protein